MTSTHAGPAIAGIPIIHEVCAPLTLVPPQMSDWRGTATSAEAIVLRHQVGDPNADGLRPIFEIEPWMTYYENADGDTAIRYHSVEATRPIQLLRTVRRGYEYVIDYQFPPDAPVERRGKEMSAFSLALAERRRGVMAHGCAFALETGKVSLCLGVSGAGKSTLARMMCAEPTARVMNDDRQAVTLEPNGFHVWSTPWPGSAGIARDGDGPLGVVVLIGRAPRPEVRSVSRREALGRLLTTLAIPSWSEAGVEYSLELVERMIERTPIVELAYPLGPDTGQWIIDRLTEITA